VEGVLSEEWGGRTQRCVVGLADSRRASKPWLTSGEERLHGNSSDLHGAGFIGTIATPGACVSGVRRALSLPGA